MDSKKTQSTMINFFWRFAERCGAQFVTLIVSIVLARVLTPSDFGTVSLVMVFITIMQAVGKSLRKRYYELFGE